MSSTSVKPRFLLFIGIKRQERCFSYKEKNVTDYIIINWNFVAEIALKNRKNVAMHKFKRWNFVISLLRKHR